MIDDLRLKSPLSKLPIINAHAHSNTCVHQITKLKSTKYVFKGKSPKLNATNIKYYMVYYRSLWTINHFNDFYPNKGASKEKSEYVSAVSREVAG